MSIIRSYILLFIPLFIACSKEPVPIINESGNDGIKFSIAISDSAGTKVTTNNRFETVFDDNDVIGLFIYMRNEGEEISVETNTLYVDNIRLTYSNGIWELEEPIYYPDSKTLLDIYAYHPYKEDAKVDSLEYYADIETSELLIASAIGIKRNENTISLRFQHMQSLVYLALSKNDNVPDFDENLSVYFNGIIGGRYNISTKELTEPLTGIIKMTLTSEANQETRSYIATVPEQTVTPGILFSIFQMTSYNEILSSNVIDQPETFTRGHVRIFFVRIKQDIPKNITYQQYDLYPKYGTPLGMVIDVYNGGKNGKVISLKNVGKVEWATLQAEAYVTGATDFNDGITNKMKIQSLENWEDDYPAFKACVDYGERWYLPCINEMKWFLTNVNNGYRLDAINNNLAHHRNNNPELGIETIYSDESYFSSTESSGSGSEALKLYTGGNWDTPPQPKHWPYYIRPFYEF